MIRYAIFLLNMLGFFIYQLFFTSGVTVSQSVPTDMMPGNDYTVELTINKGNIGGFAKLQQELPQGCTATPVESKSASFSMSGNAVKFIWTSLPSDAEFKISYKISVSGKATLGPNILSGKFFYVTDNVKQSVDIPESNFNIGGEATTTAADSTKSRPADLHKSDTAIAAVTSTNTDTTKVALQPTLPVPDQNAPPASSGKVGDLINGSRKITANGSKDYTVEVSIVRGNVTGFAKLQENLPPGFSASALQNNGASFSFTDQKVKMVWINLPLETEVKISYKVTGPAANLSIDGVFSYIENDETKKYILSAANTKFETKPEPEAVSENKTDAATIGQTNTSANNSNLITPMVPSPQTAVNFKVQVCALKQTPVSVSYFSTRYGLNVGQELHEGWTKYTVVDGFKEYKPARDYREKVRTKGVINPFVTAYNSGKRITVQEALMITSQKWYP